MHGRDNYVTFMSHMLKSYIVSDSTKFVHSVNVISSDPAPNENYSEQFEQTISLAKFENSDIWNNLDSKLSHLQQP